MTVLRSFPNPLRLLALACAATVLAACAATPVADTPRGSTPAASTTAPVPELRPGVLAGYLAADAIPDSLALVPPPPPPAAGSAALAQDHAVMRAALALRGTPRFEQAARDADLDFPFAAGTFACTLGVRIDAERTPATYRLLRRSLCAISTNGCQTLPQRLGHHHHARATAKRTVINPAIVTFSMVARVPQTHIHLTACIGAACHAAGHKGSEQFWKQRDDVKAHGAGRSEWANGR